MAAGTPLHGISGYIAESTGSIWHVTGWELKESVSPYETTALSSTTPTHKSFGFIAPAEADGTIECLMDDVEHTIAAGTVIGATLSASATIEYVGSFGIVDITHRVNRGSEQTVTYAVKLNGTLTRS